MLARKWFWHFPGMIYAHDFEFKRPVSRKEVLERLREWLQVRRLPSGTAVWPKR